MTPRRGSRALVRYGVVAAIGVSAWGLVGCGSDRRDAEPGVAATGVATTGVVEPVASAENGSSATTAPQAFVFESGVLEIGDFDPYTLGDNIFDPCTEITPEEFAAAGFDRVEPLPEEYAGLARGLSVCEILDGNGIPISDFTTNNVNRELIAQESRIMDEVKSSVLPTAFAYRSTAGKGGDCFVQVDTVRGGLSSGISGSPDTEDPTPACESGMRQLEELFLANS